MSNSEDNSPEPNSSGDKSLKPSELLQFYRDYLLRARADASQDKTSLTTITNIKLTVFGLILVLFSKGIGIIGVIFLPVIMFSLDYLHKTRFEEIFDRYRYSSKCLAKKIKELPGLESFELLENQFYKNYCSKIYQNREARVRTMVTSLAIFLSIVAMLFSIDVILENNLNSYIDVNDIWIVRIICCLLWLWFLYRIYFMLFLRREQKLFHDTYVGYSMNRLFFFLILLIIVFNIFDIMDYLTPLLIKKGTSGWL